MIVSTDNQGNREILMPGVYRDRLMNGQIFIYGVQVKSRESTDCWAQAVLADVATWDEQAPYLTMHHFTEGAVEQTPYNRTAATRLARTLPANLHGRIAITIQDLPLAYLARMFASYSLGLLLPRHIQSKVTSDYDEALAWLCEGLGN